VTSRRERKNMALRGEIDQLKRMISMDMVHPLKKVSMKGEMKSVEPYSLTLTNTYDDANTIQADVTVDTNKRSFSLRTNYDLEHPERTLNVKAMYVNDTAVKATVYRDHVNDVITDALLALRLNTSTLLHSRVHWRPASMDDLQEYAVYKLSKYASSTKDTVTSVSDAVREELAARYALSAVSMSQDLAPLMELVEQELNDVTGHLHNMQRQLARLYRRNPALQQMGSAATEKFQKLQLALSEMTDAYQQRVVELTTTMKESLDIITRYPVGHLYDEAIRDIINSFEEMVDSGLSSVTEAVVSLDSYLLAARQNSIHLSNHISAVAHNMSSDPRVQYFKKSLDLSPYIKAAASKISSVRMPEEYSAAIYRASSNVNNAVNDFLNMEAMKQVKETSNEIYQQGMWAYKYWQKEQNIVEHLESIVQLLKEIVHEELALYTPHFRFLQDSHVTVWQPMKGEIQAELSLPVAMETLDSMPDVTPIVDGYNNAVDRYVPDMDTVQYFYDNYVPQSKWWADNNTTEKQPLLGHLNEYTPEVKPRKLYKRKYNKRASVSAM